jgi:hypothetical protein
LHKALATIARRFRDNFKVISQWLPNDFAALFIRLQSVVRRFQFDFAAIAL